MLEYFTRLLIEGAALELGMAQREGAVIAGIDRPHLYIRLAVAQVVLLCQLLAYIAVARFIVDSRDCQFFVLVVVQYGEEMEFADQPGRKILGDKAFVFKIAHGEVQRLAPVAARNIGEPGLIFLGGRFADATRSEEHTSELQ